jgi:hypothetical protein
MAVGSSQARAFLLPMSFPRLLPLFVIFLLLWGTRLLSLESLPLHNDEGLHLTRAVEVWNGHPFWNISDGKIVNHWLIAAFYPQSQPVFAGRFATLVTAMIGLAAALALGKRMSGSSAAVLMGALWITTPYLFFYERLAFSDAQAGAWVVLAVYLAVRCAESLRMRDALWTGLALGAALLFKFTAAPYTLAIALVMLLWSVQNGRLLWVRLKLLVIIGAMAAACFIPPLLYLLLRGQDFFEIALGWISPGGGSGGLAVIGNLENLAAQLTGFGSVTWVVFTGLGLVLLLAQNLIPRRQALVLFLAAVVPFIIILVLGRQVLSRHFVVGLPLLLTMAGLGVALALRRIRNQQNRILVTGFGVVALFFGWVPFGLTAYTDPAWLPLPPDARYEHITSHSSGYGLQEAMQALPTVIAEPDVPVVGSMFPDSCRRANFYAVGTLRLRCDDAPGLDLIEAALVEQGAVYVLIEQGGQIGLAEVDFPSGTHTLVGEYARPGDAAAAPSLRLWLLRR